VAAIFIFEAIYSTASPGGGTIFSEIIADSEARNAFSVLPNFGTLAVKLHRNSGGIPAEFATPTRKGSRDGEEDEESSSATEARGSSDGGGAQRVISKRERVIIAGSVVVVFHQINFIP